MCALPRISAHCPLGFSLAFSPKSDAECVAGCTALDCCDYSTTFGSATKLDEQFDAGRLDGWYLESDSSDSSIPTPFVKILYNHGSGSNLAARYRTDRYKFLLTLGVKLFVYDYPGCVCVGALLTPQAVLLLTFAHINAQVRQIHRRSYRRLHH